MIRTPIRLTPARPNAKPQKTVATLWRMKNAAIRARIDSGLKANALRVLASCGLEASDAIRLFLQQVVAHQGIPFVIPSAERAPSMAELQVLKR